MDITVLTLEGFRQEMWEEIRRYGTKNAMKYLSKGADPHKPRFGYTVLIAAAMDNDLTLINYLINIAHVDIEAANENGDTAVVVATKYSNTAAFKLLVELGADTATYRDLIKFSAEFQQNDEILAILYGT